MATELPGFTHHELDIRDRAGVLPLVRAVRPTAIVHTAAQPSHDRAAAIPLDNFNTNALACPESPFVHMSTNKGYGDAMRQAYPRCFNRPTCAFHGDRLTRPR